MKLFACDDILNSFSFCGFLRIGGRAPLVRLNNFLDWLTRFCYHFSFFIIFKRFSSLLSLFYSYHLQKVLQLIFHMELEHKLYFLALAYCASHQSPSYFPCHTTVCESGLYAFAPRTSSAYFSSLSLPSSHLSLDAKSFPSTVFEWMHSSIEWLSSWWSLDSALCGAPTSYFLSYPHRPNRHPSAPPP